MLLFFLFLFVAPAGGERDIVITTYLVFVGVKICASVCVRLDFVHAITSIFML